MCVLLVFVVLVTFFACMVLGLWLFMSRKVVFFVTMFSLCFSFEFACCVLCCRWGKSFFD